MHRFGKIMLTSLCILLIIYSVVSNAQIDDPVVSVEDGTIRGSLQRTESNIPFYAFTGLPYAQAPVGNLRFQPPVPVSPWDGILEVTKPPPACLQSAFGITKGSEDCLIVNIYTKSLPLEEQILSPVLVYIHGGAFVAESSDEYRPDYLLEHDLVIVTINYRLGVFGFLTTQDEAAQGNAGLKDQVLALKWVQNNIRHFNGDPSRVTIAGTSAGSASVDYHLLSPLSAGLFQQAILQSGSALDKWALQRTPILYLERLAANLGFSNESSQELVANLQNVEPITLVTASNDVGFSNFASAWPFVPTIENEHPGAFLSSSPYSIMEQQTYNLVDFMVGTCTAEGTYGQGYFDAGVMNIQEWEEDVTKFVSESLNNVDDPVAVGQLIKTSYFGDSPVTDKEKFVKFMSQEQFIRGLRKLLQFKRGDGTQGYIYQLSYKGSFTTRYEGAGHGEDVQYIWRYPGIPLLSEADHLASERLTLLWANFVTTGNPTPETDPILESVILPSINDFILPVLDVGENISLLPNPQDETQFAAWETIFSLYGKPPFVTY